MAVKPVDPSPDPEGREANLAGNGRARLPVGTRLDDLGSLHDPKGRCAGMGQAVEFGRFFLCQCAHLQCHGTPSKQFLEGI